ncbi:MAG: hypothetical protein GF355_01210 [Candidatus Eisenbacteria bacterium]|nr:hypothetical protein [Candidatus Eisenbacteria bacterium]
MSLESIERETRQKPLVVIDPGQLSELLKACRIVREEKTAVCAPIRILQCGDSVYVQETSDRNEILVRRMASEAEAEGFVDRRLEAYDRMWDGCGCKIDYYEKRD